MNLQNPRYNLSIIIKYEVIKATHNIQDVSLFSLSLKKTHKNHGIFLIQRLNCQAGKNLLDYIK